MSTYRDPATGRLYRVGPQPYKGCYWVYYLDPKSSAIWKKCTPPGLHAGNATTEGEEEYLRGNAQRNGWALVAKACEACPCPACEAQYCPQAGCDGSDKGYGCIAPDEDCPSRPSHVPPSTEPPEDLAPIAPSSLPTFDYSGLDEQTVADLHLAEREYTNGRKLVEVGLRRMADGVAIAHDALCASDATKCRNGDGTFFSPEKTFGRWCDSVGLNRKAAERLLQVARLFENSTPREEKVLAELGPSLLYAAAKPSAPPALVQAVKNGDITTHKEYQALLARYNAEKAARENAEQAREESRRMAGVIAGQRDEERRRADEAERQRDGTRDALAAAKLRGDKLAAENDALRAAPIEAQAVDEDEVNRRAQARADALTAPLRAELDALRAAQPAGFEQAEQAIRDAYDSAIYTGRVIESAWRSLGPLLPRMDAGRRTHALDRLRDIFLNIQGEIEAWKA